MTKPLKILHITTHDEECGIGKYQEQFLKAMQPLDGVVNTVFEDSPNQTKLMTKAEFVPVLKRFAVQMQDHDILHVQHEFSFYSKDELDEIVSEAKRQNKPVIITVHTSLHAGIPSFQFKSLTKGLRHIVGAKRLRQYLVNVHVTPMKKADLILVHNSVTAGSLQKYGVAKNKIHRITMPVPQVDFGLKTAKIGRHLHRQPGDIILCTVGFLSETKGMREALQALAQLPVNYKLAMIGGAHPSGANDAFCKEINAQIKQQGLSARAYVTGYIKDDGLLNALIRECDICVYPFDKHYYAGVTSASLNNSLANHKPAIAYPTPPILEMNSEMSAVITCKSFSYHDLAHEIININIKRQTAIARRYAHAFGYNREAVGLVKIYRLLAQP